MKNNVEYFCSIEKTGSNRTYLMNIWCVENGNAHQINFNYGGDVTKSLVVEGVELTPCIKFDNYVFEEGSFIFKAMANGLAAAGFYPDVPEKDRIAAETKVAFLEAEIERYRKFQDRINDKVVDKL